MASGDRLPLAVVVDPDWEDSPANGTSARVSPADERLVSRVFRVFVSQPQKTLPIMSGHLPQSGIFLPSARRLSEFGRLAALV